MNLRHLAIMIAMAISALTISGCQSGPGYDNPPAYGGGYNDGGNSGY